MAEKLSGVELEKIISLSYFVIDSHKAKAIINTLGKVSIIS